SRSPRLKRRESPRCTPRLCESPPPPDPAQRARAREISPPNPGRKKIGGTPSGSDAAAAAPGRPLGRGGGLPRSLGRAVGLPPPPRSLGRGGGTASPATRPPTMDGFNGGGFSNFSGGFPFPSSLDGSCGGGLSMYSSLLDAAGGEASSPGSWNNGSFMSYFSNQPHNSHLVGAINQAHNNDDSSPSEVEVLLGNENENQNVIAEKRTEKRIMWNMDEDVRLTSAWIEHSTDSTCGADKGGGQYWGEVVETYNKTTPPLRRRSSKQCKDRWHKINKWTDLFECAYVKARRVFTSGYSNEQWIDAAHKFYLSDNKDNKDVVGPFMLMEVWKICRDVPKWKTYNENLKNARKRKSFHLEGDSEENEDTSNEMPERPMGQKAAKKAALAAKGKSKGSSSSDDGHSKESPIDLDKFDRYSKFQEENNEQRMKLLDRQEKLSSEKLEATKIAHLTAQEYKEGKKLEKESKMMETYNNLISQDTSSMSAEEKALRVSMMKCVMKTLFPESD
ncbi:unnamed protein product, partial [Urochloa humidicola]